MYYVHTCSNLANIQEFFGHIIENGNVRSLSTMFLFLSLLSWFFDHIRSAVALCGLACYAEVGGSSTIVHLFKIAGPGRVDNVIPPLELVYYWGIFLCRSSMTHLGRRRRRRGGERSAFNLRRFFRHRKGTHGSSQGVLEPVFAWVSGDDCLRSTIRYVGRGSVEIL